MEHVLDVYKRSYNPQIPVVCMDESGQQLIEEVRTPLAARPRSVRKIDDEYVRNGVAEIFMVIEPLGGQRYVQITEKRRRYEWAQFVKYLVDDCYPSDEWIVLVMDNLNTHQITSLYQSFEPSEAHRLRNKLELHSKTWQLVKYR